ncbi:MAG: aminotransferase class V-fold PLP-dependent enzyme [Ilumatobacteraceae bacterium]
MLSDVFPDAHGYLNTATLGLPTGTSVEAITAHLAEWRDGRCDPPTIDHEIDRCRDAFGRIVGVGSERVAIQSQVSVVSALVASSLPDGARVLCAEEDFTSVLYPFLVDRRLDVHVVPLDALLDHISGDVDLVAVSAVQSADGRRLDLDALAVAARDAAARTYVDITQAASWVSIDAGRFDVTACGAYKWLCSPRGAAFMTVDEAATDWLVPRAANWYAGADRWGGSIYGPAMELPTGARRYDVSPAWITWIGATPALEVLAGIGPDAIGRHDVALADRLRAALDLPPGDSAIVSLDVDGGVERLTAAGIRCAGRAGKVRLSFHLYNTTDDVDLAAEILTDRRRTG